MDAAVIPGLLPGERNQAFADAARRLFTSRLFTDLAETVPGIEQLVDPDEIFDLNQEDLEEYLQDRARELYDRKEAAVGPELMRQIERSWLLRIIDARWMGHLKEMDYMREAIGLRAYGQKDPIIEYQKEAFSYFEALMAHIAEDVTRAVLLTEVEASVQEREMGALEASQREVEDLSEGAPAPRDDGLSTPMSEAAEGMTGPTTHVATSEPRRNDPCPCGSGKKYKHCCMGKQAKTD